MTVKQLKEALAAIEDDSLEVYAYDTTSEEWCGKFKVRVVNKFPYVKDDPPSDLPEKFVVLRGGQY